MRTAKRFLELLSILVKPGEGQHHNLTIDNEGDFVLSMMCGEQYVHFILSDPRLDIIESDLESAARDIADETLDYLEKLRETKND